MGLEVAFDFGHERSELLILVFQWQYSKQTLCSAVKPDQIRCRRSRPIRGRRRRHRHIQPHSEAHCSLVFEILVPEERHRRHERTEFLSSHPAVTQIRTT